VRAESETREMDSGTASRGPITRRLLLWVLFVSFCTLGMVQLTYAYTPLPISNKVTYFQLMLVLALALGTMPLLRTAGGPDRGVARTMCRILIAYLLFELLVVVPVALWLGTAKLTAILGTMDVRIAWVLFPTMLVICADERARRWAGQVTVIAAVCLVAWGLFSAATGGGGYYVEFGDVRYRILQGQGSLLFAWPFMLACSGAVSRRHTFAFLGLAAAGLVLTNHRSDLIAFAVAGLLCLFMSGQFRRALTAIVPIALVAGIVALLWGGQVSTIFGYTVSHLFDISSGNGADRMMRWRLAWEFFSARPFNDYVWSWRYYLVNLGEAYAPHNFALEIAGREGVAGLLFYGSMLWTPLHRAWEWGRRDTEARALVGWLVFYIVFSLMNANHYLPTSMPLFVGALAALASRIDSLSHAGGRDRDGDFAGLAGAEVPE
jgi:O-antigen ligase